jgi:outer membrane protein TolC
MVRSCATAHDAWDLLILSEKRRVTMNLGSRLALGLRLALLCGLQAGCSTLLVTTPPQLSSPTTRVEVAAPSEIKPVVYATPAPSLASAFAEMSDLSDQAVVEGVLARNPSLAQMTAAWQAASARFPQVTSLEDPMFGTRFGPGSIASDTVNFAYAFEVSQKIPYPGKRGLRGDVALAEASAAGRDVDDIRLQLIESARAAFYEYYLAERGLEVNAEGLRLLKEFRENAVNRYRTGLTPQQDILQADVEIGRESERKLNLEQMRAVAIARINTLMHLPPDAPLPPSSKQLGPVEVLSDTTALRRRALVSRPDLQALADRLKGDEAALALTVKEFCPDFEVMAAYDSFWQEPPLRTQVGVRLNLPIYQAKRHAAVAEAEARVAQRRAELARRSDEINYQVQEAAERVRKSEKAARLYEETILPTAKANVETARSAYITGKIPFLNLVEAQRNQVGLRERYYETLAEYFRQRAVLERVVGGPLAPALAGTTMIPDAPSQPEAPASECGEPSRSGPARTDPQPRPK